MKEMECISAEAKGVVEHGALAIRVGDRAISLTIQERSDGDFQVYLDDDTKSNRELLKSMGVEMTTDPWELERCSDKIISEDFISEIRFLYRSYSTCGQNAGWQVDNWSELSETLEWGYEEID